MGPSTGEKWTRLALAARWDSLQGSELRVQGLGFRPQGSNAGEVERHSLSNNFITALKTSLQHTANTYLQPRRPMTLKLPLVSTAIHCNHGRGLSSLRLYIQDGVGR